jgi:anaerobic magnesium-protoporphyrin IX monomethyl ester cyclase
LAPATPLNLGQAKVLIVDLNNFSTFPTMAVGILIAALRNRAFSVQLISPLEHDVPAVERERPDHYFDHLARRIHLSTSPPLQGARNALRAGRHWWLNRPHPRVLRETAKALAGKPDVLLLSAYLQHNATVREIGKLAQAAGVPMLLGGPMFNIEPTAEQWLTVPGLTALVGGEVDLTLPDMVNTLLRGEDLLRFSGVMLPDGRRSNPMPPLRTLDAVPVPDFTDFPWDRYRVRIIPLMSGRGCQWAECTFCSDIISASGRTFRTRSVESVLHEMREQSQRHATRNFLFLDLKLNSHPGMFRGIIEGVQSAVPGAQWIGTVHVDQRPDNGLSRADLKAAAGAGMRRVSFGLESGSQRLLDSMRKGCNVERNEEFLRHARDAGLSVRCTMFKGYPGETPEDLELTTSFIERNSDNIDRIRFNDLSIQIGTQIHAQISRFPQDFADLKIEGLDRVNSRALLASRVGESRAYRTAKSKLLREIYKINSKRIRSSARDFDGLM